MSPGAAAWMITWARQLKGGPGGQSGTGGTPRPQLRRQLAGPGPGQAASGFPSRPTLQLCWGVRPREKSLLKDGARVRAEEDGSEDTGRREFCD